ncbi:MAG: formimidoylglutamase [Saprospiraceae bacterium]|nr:formimidoylglutamase [Saprospiraceae bacterium]
MRQWAKSEWWSGRIDDVTNDNATRWHQKVRRTTAIESNSDDSGGCISLIGYASDLGTKVNQGRTGSALGPAKIRKALGNLAWHREVTIIDQGDITNDHSVAAIQEELAVLISSLRQQGHFSIVLGGSHDMTFGHYKGIYDHLSMANDRAKMGVINFDAHLDLRPYQKGPHSGSSFLQIADFMNSRQRDFKYFCLGIEKLANTPSLYHKANDLGAYILDANDCHLFNLESITAQLDKFTSDLDFILLSIDMDGFKSCHAPGVSAPAHVGYDPEFVQALLPYLFSSRKIVGLDIAETNPSYDLDARTSRLAAALIHQIVDLC